MRELVVATAWKDDEVDVEVGADDDDDDDDDARRATRWRRAA